MKKDRRRVWISQKEYDQKKWQEKKDKELQDKVKATQQNAKKLGFTYIF